MSAVIGLRTPRPSGQMDPRPLPARGSNNELTCIAGASAAAARPGARETQDKRGERRGELRRREERRQDASSSCGRSPSPKCPLAPHSAPQTRALVERLELCSQLATCNSESPRAFPFDRIANSLSHAYTDCTLTTVLRVQSTVRVHTREK